VGDIVLLRAHVVFRNGLVKSIVDAGRRSLAIPVETS